MSRYLSHLFRLVCLLLASLAPSVEAAGPSQEDLAGQRALSDRVGGGFVVWESSRSGSWRLYYRNLDGSGFRRLSPDEPGRHHYCPHISPDGRYVAYLSYPDDTDTYGRSPKADQRTPLHLIDVRTGEDRVLVDQARAYYEDRAVVWLNPNALIYIDGAGNTRQIDLTTGRSTALTRDGGRRLINAAFTWAVSGRPHFARYDRADQSIHLQHKFGGCQPYFTADGAWAFWMAGAGGPVNRLRLASGEVSPILAKNDHRLPDDRSYIYFPMISHDRQLIALGASPNQHDHFRSDYDIFVAPLDPETLALTGDPVRYSFDPGCDRFPDVFVHDLELGRWAGEAPFTVRLKAPRPDGVWRWRFSDGSELNGPTAIRTFDEPGRYRVDARLRDQSAQGEIMVHPSTPPTPLRAVLIGGRKIQVAFDEPVAIDAAEFRLGSGVGLEPPTLNEDRTTVTLRPHQPIRDADMLHVAGVTDRAQRPNAMADAAMTVKPLRWPTNRQGLVYLFATAEKPNHVLAEADGEPRSFPLTPRGRARLDHDHAMLVDDGAFIAESAGPEVSRAAQHANALTVEALIQPFKPDQRGPARIVSLSTDSGHRNFTLGQERDQLVFRLRTTQNGNNGTNEQPRLGKIGLDQPTHVVVTYTPGRMIAYLDGEPVLQTDRVRGDLSNWQPQTLLFGDEYRDDRDWHGRIEHVAVYARVLDAAEVHANYRQVEAALAARPDVESFDLRAKLLARSDMPTLEQINPYRRGLVVCEYAPIDPPAGVPDRIRVVHWALLDGRPQSIARLEVGRTIDLRLRRFDDNPQLDGLFISDTLPLDLEAELYFHATP